MTAGVSMDMGMVAESSESEWDRGRPKFFCPLASIGRMDAE